MNRLIRRGECKDADADERLGKRRSQILDCPFTISSETVMRCAYLVRYLNPQPFALKSYAYS